MNSISFGAIHSETAPTIIGNFYTLRLSNYIYSMIGAVCPNIDICRLVNACDYRIDKEVRESYLKQYCKTDTENREDCNRYIVKEKLNFCPDFVLPDSGLSSGEVMDKFDEDETLT